MLLAFLQIPGSPVHTDFSSTAATFSLSLHASTTYATRILDSKNVKLSEKFCFKFNELLAARSPQFISNKRACLVIILKKRAHPNRQGHTRPARGTSHTARSDTIFSQIYLLVRYYISFTLTNFRLKCVLIITSNSEFL